jgi:DNA helicase II / ATP-dependent DNA helicase PcrA
VDKRGPDAVFVTSFTRAAAAELVGRDLPIERDHIGTLHSFCFRALGQPTIAETKIAEWNESHPTMLMSGEVKNKDEAITETVYNTDADRDFALYQIYRARMIPLDSIPIQQVHDLAVEWEQWKDASHYTDFTDMIERCLEGIERAPGDPEVMFVDEVQDSPLLQLTLLRKWATHTDMMIMSGDDDQALYQWAGALPDAFLKPDLPADRKRVLRQSYRVPRAVHAVSQEWISQLGDRREPKEYRPRDADGLVRTLPVRFPYPEPLVEDVEKQVKDGRTVMILSSCGYMLDPLKKALREVALPYHNPLRRSRGDWNPLHPGKGRSASERLLAFLRPQDTVWGDDWRLWTADDLRLWIGGVRAEGNTVKGAKTKLEGDVTTEPMSMERLERYLTPDTINAALSGDLRWFRSILLPTAERSMDFALRVLEHRGAAALREEPKVTIGTIHSVKGGESQVVYVYPDLSMAGMREWVGGDQDGRDAIVRQFYVGMTRAKEELVLCAGASPWRVDLPQGE